MMHRPYAFSEVHLIKHGGKYSNNDFGLYEKEKE